MPWEPPSLIKSIRALAKFMDDILELRDCHLDRRLSDGEQLKDAAKAKLDKINDEIQSASDELTEDMKTACTKVYDEAKARYKKAMVAANTVLGKSEVIDPDFPNAKARSEELEAVEDSRPCKLEAKNSMPLRTQDRANSRRSSRPLRNQDRASSKRRTRGR